MKKILSILIFATLFSPFVMGQKFLWDVNYRMNFDNREYSTMQTTNKSQTLFGAFLTPQIGFGIGDHSVMFGGNLLRNFGQQQPKYHGDLMLYYNYNSERFKANVGSFPSHKLIGGYSTAFFSDDILYYDTSIEGIQLQYWGKRGFFELVLDWLSMKDGDAKEIFAIYSATRWNFDWFFLGYNADLGHYVGNGGVVNVVDNYLVYPFIGLDLSKTINFEKAELKLGWMQSVQRDRYYVGDFVYPNGAMIELGLEKWNIGINNSFYYGDNLMPYYYNTDYYGDQYGSWVYHGELFYHTDSKIYDKLEVYWRPFKNDYFNLDITLRFHFDGVGNMGSQQLAKVSLNLNNFTLNKLKSKLKKNNDK
jgi:hypothetical protein